MIKWDESIIINKSIDDVWEVLNDPNYTKVIMPQVVSTKLISEDISTNTRVYEESYQEGKRIETYELVEIITCDETERKSKFFTFTIANMLCTESNYTLTKIDEDSVKLQYDGINKGVSMIGKIVLRLAQKSANTSIVLSFLYKVKEVCEQEKS